jgi:Na+-transporting methylmalonyl-CoA/oxaloacetate decarboxylase gamma subunit
MENSLLTALAITAIGMTLLFLALALFYGLLSLMMSIFERRAKPKALETKEPITAESGVLLRAAAVAVAMARAEAGQGDLTAPAPATGAETGREPPSPWWLLHHQRNVRPKPNARRLP